MGEKRRDAVLLCAQSKQLCCEFLKSLKIEYNTISEEYKSNNAKKLIASVSEVLQELNQKQVAALWKDLFKLSFGELECISKSIGCENRDQDNEMEMDDGSSFQVLETVCVLLLASVRLEEPVATNEMVQTLILLHGGLLDLHEIRPTLASCISAICVKWWNKELASRDLLCLNTITLLLRSFFHNDTRDKLSSICNMHDCLSLFDFKRQLVVAQPAENEGTPFEATYARSVIEELRQMLIKSFQHPKFLSDTGGRKFLSSVMLLHKDLMKDCHWATMESIEHKFPLVKAEALGNVYFQIWRTADEEMKEAFEEICIQDLMFRAARAPQAKDYNLFPPLRAMLTSVVRHKGSREVRQMITRLYSPILWRSLKANNAIVRANAYSLLLDAFPMEEDVCNQARVAESEEFMQRQYDAFDNMLTDSCPRIRVIGIIGLCKVLHLYWDAIPAQIIAILVRKLYIDLAFDATVEVRQAVFKGTITLLDTPCAHPLLSKLLPACVEKCMHDVSEKVRITAADVLLAVKQTSTISFWSVCPIRNIIAQLEIDGLPVSKRLVKLLFRSFIPEDQPVQVWVERCANFFKRDVNTARKFYSLVEKDLTVEEIGEFLNLIGIFVFNCVSRKLHRENSSMAESDTSTLSGTSNNDMSQLTDSAIENDVLSALLDTSCILWKSLIRRVSEKDRETMKRIMITFSRTIHICFKVANDERTLDALLMLSANLPPASLPVFSKSLLPKLRSLPDDAPLSYYGMLIKCICSWDWTKQILDLVCEWLVEATGEFESDESELSEKVDAISQETSESVRRSQRPPSSKSSATRNKKKVKEIVKKKKVVTFTGVKQEHRPSQALKYLEAFLEEQSTRSFTAFDKEPCLKLLLTISKQLEKCQNAISERLLSPDMSESKTWPGSLLVEANEIQCKLITVIYSQQKSQVHGGDAGDPTISADVSIEEFKSFVKRFTDLVKHYQTMMKAQVDLNSSVLSSEMASTTVLSRLSFCRQVFTSFLSAYLDFLLCGIPVFDEVEEAITLFCASDTNLIDYISLLMKILSQLAEHKILKTYFDSQVSDIEREKNEDDDKLNLKLIEIFDDLITTLLQHARRSPDSFMHLFRQEMRPSLRILVCKQHLAHSLYPDQVWYSVLIKKTVSAVLADLFQETRSSNNLASLNRISDLPAFSASILPVICANSAETSYVCKNTILTLAREESSERKEQILEIFALLLHIMSQDGKNKTAALSCIATLTQDLPGFDIIYAKWENNGNDDAPEKEEATKERNSEQEEKIVILENPDQQGMFVNDEEFML